MNNSPSKRAARVLYDFEGKAGFREPTIEAGDDWSLLRASSGEIGLLPQTYYMVSTDHNDRSMFVRFILPVKCMTSFLSTPLAIHRRKEPCASRIAPTLLQEESKPVAIVPLGTGEWTIPLPCFRQSLLRGKKLNRFSRFATSGAEEWILEGYVDPVASISSSSHQRISTEDSINDDNGLSRPGLGEADRHYVDAGPTRQSKVPRFRSWFTHLLSAYRAFQEHIPCSVSLPCFLRLRMIMWFIHPTDLSYPYNSSMAVSPLHHVAHFAN
ncbi:hypothetical protein BDR04DRAFT_1103933 [Suillus decipiens]|nr:hypothetical protein BDR04DRAFT_1103933 [Suillus decipiens]